MTNLSYWARDHKGPARILLIACFSLLYATGLFAGSQIRTLSIQFGNYFLVSVTFVYACFYFYYPYVTAKETLGKNRYYQRILIARMGLTTCLFALILYVGNHSEKIQPFSPFMLQANAIVPAKDSPLAKYWTPTEFKSMMKDAHGKKLKLKERKKLLKQQIIAVQASGTNTAEKALLIALSILVALGAFYAVAILSCSLSCNGMGELAVILLIGGTFLIIFGLIKYIKHISRRRPSIKD